MDYTNLLRHSAKRSRVGIIGATRGYGYTLLAQIPGTAHMDLRVICSRHPEECRHVLEEIDGGRSGICGDRRRYRPSCVYAGAVGKGAGPWVPCPVPGDDPWFPYHGYREQYDAGAPAGNDRTAFCNFWEIVHNAERRV